MDSAGAANLEGRDSVPFEIDETAMIGEVEAAALQSATTARLAGDTFGRYRILKTLGEGAMGSVYLALDTQLQRKVALKLPKVNSHEQARFIDRFLREARSAATLSHPNICPVYDVGVVDGQHFITMAYIQGHSLSEFVSPDRSHNERHIATVVRKIALALHDAHANGLVHRDVKPANVMIDHRGEPIIMDFGLARQMDDEQDSRLTRDGAILGSPAYMSPEQIEGRFEKIGPSCDIYSLGVILYELLTGQLPFQGSVASIIGQILSKDPVNPTRIRPSVSTRLADISLKAMAKKPEDRFASMREFGNALAEFLKSKADDLSDKESEREKSKATDQAKAPAKETLKEQPKEPAKETVKERERDLGDPASRGGASSRKPAGAAPAGPQLTTVELEVTCRCGQRMIAKPHMAGKMVRCPRCAEILQIPAIRATTHQQQVDCQYCGQRFLARDELVGKVVKCPVCSKPLTVTRPGSTASTAHQIAVTCGCGQQFLARPELAGKRVRCTSCGDPITIPRTSQ